MHPCGKLKSWNTDKKFGFIKPDAGGADVFVHLSALPERKKPPHVGARLQYVMGVDRSGRPCAERAWFVSQAQTAAATAPQSAPTVRHTERRGSRPFANHILLIPCLFALGLLVASAFALLNWQVTLLYFVLSIITFGVYAKDKSAAQSGQWRTPEATLHVLALFGGWPGAIFARHILRHKSQKMVFRIVFWLTVLANLVALVWMIDHPSTIAW